MTDYNPPAEGKVLEFTRTGTIPWIYDVTAGDAMLKKPSLAERLPNGLIMVNDDYRNRVVVIDPADDSIVWQYGITDQSGTTPGMLSIPDGFDNLLANGTTPTHLADRLILRSSDRAWTREAGVGQVATGPASAPRDGSGSSWSSASGVAAPGVVVRVTRCRVRSGCVVSVWRR